MATNVTYIGDPKRDNMPGHELKSYTADDGTVSEPERMPSRGVSFMGIDFPLNQPVEVLNDWPGLAKLENNTHFVVEGKVGRPKTDVDNPGGTA